jgi:hypothetical protein
LIAAGLTSRSPTGQQHPLFTSSAEVYENAAQQIPGRLEPVGVSDAVKSVQAILAKSHLKARRPGQRFGRLPPARPSSPPRPPSPPAIFDATTAPPKLAKVEEDERKTLSILLQKIRSYDDQLRQEFGEMQPITQRNLLDEISHYLRRGMGVIQSFESRERGRNWKRRAASPPDHGFKEKRQEARKLMVNLEMKVTQLYEPFLSENLAPEEVNSGTL